MKRFKKHTKLETSTEFKPFLCGPHYDIKEGEDQGVFDILGWSSLSHYLRSLGPTM